jgi:RND family efflux transporter MFP subunit
LSAARGALAQTQSSLALATMNHDRAQKLAPSGIVSQQELQQYSAALASAEAAEVASKAQIAGLAVRIGETRIEAPLDGIVSVRRLDPGSLVGPPGGGAIITIVRTDRLRVFITINERSALGVAVGNDAHVELDAVPDKSYTGKVVRIAPSFEPVARTLEAEVQLDNRSGELRPGMYGRGAIVLAVHPQVIVVPVSAVQLSEGRAYVFVLKGDTVVRTAIVTGVDGGEWLEVKQGLHPGDQVVSAGADGLSDGATVRVARNVDPYTGAPTSAAETAAGSSGRKAD